LCAQRDDVLRYVIALLTSRLGVMDLQILHGSAHLAFPCITLQDLLAQLLVGAGIQAKSRPFQQSAQIISRQ